MALTLAGTVGCSGGVKAPVAGLAFLQPGDVELFSALSPAVVTELGSFDAAQRKALVEAVLRNVDATCAAMHLGARQEVRKLLDLLAIAPLRYALTGCRRVERSRHRQDAGLPGALARQPLRHAQCRPATCWSS